ncbi:MAG: AAA family ATPase [Spirochaetes bacterium]|nr:MAG: AAA family ATPase [Spirochaetota bacterium]
MPLQLKKELNEKQYQAAVQLEGPLLVIAGAGSGKTRMITFRIAYMLEMGIHQSNILALTFTNKAALEMSERVKEITGQKLSNLTVSTFHAFGVKVLRKTIDKLGYKDTFSIYDQTDKISAIKNAAREMGIHPESLDTFELANLFSGIKMGRIKWNDGNRQFKELYNSYMEHLFLYNAVDFDDLINLPIKIFKEFPDILKAYQQQFKYIMVDEFQDTSSRQYEFIKMLGTRYRNLCVVGDDDQSIYSWRGANYQNIVNFELDFPELVEIKLEQNYRSTKNILAAANKLISHNKNRKEKELWTGVEHGRSIEIFYPENETREAEFITEMIQTLTLKEGVKYHDFGILVRTNSLSAMIENALLSDNIPYKVSGGKSFFQRKEIKDIVAYMRILENPDDDVNLLRILNTPRRGIGNATLKKIRELADRQDYSLYSAMVALKWAADSPVTQKAKASIDDFIDLIEYFREKIAEGQQLVPAIKNLIERIDYWGYLLLEHQKNDKVAKWKYKNVGIFMDIFERWEKNPDNKGKGLINFLNKITLITRDEESDDEKGKLNLMTIHASKGLEFEIVFLAGVENNIIPHARSIEENPDNIEEERRLFYVAITRAKKKLFMTSCRTRKIGHEIVDTGPSPFLEEIPKELIEFHVPETSVDQEEAEDYFARIKSSFK